MRTLPEVLTLDRPMLGIDLETTGKNPQTARIVELGLEIMVPGRPTKEYRTLINPGVPIPPPQTRVHQITDDMVRDAPTFESLADNLLKGFIGADFTGYSVRFDLRIIAAEFLRAKRVWDYEAARIIDGLRLWQIVEGRSLDDAWEYWVTGPDKITPQEVLETLGDGQSHSALYDIKRSTRVIANEIARHAGKLPRDVQQLHDLCWPGWFDADGKLQWRHGELEITFGEHRDTPLRNVPRGYLNWITQKNFSAKVKDACREALHGRYPVAPKEDSDEDDAT